eukprot:10048621-Alexandrium_andersonii.AAC.1
MSASLVGSEMCIRDRPCPPAEISPPGRCDPCAFPDVCLRGGPRHTAAVSYTHLTLPTICSV